MHEAIRWRRLLLAELLVFATNTAPAQDFDRPRGIYLIGGVGQTMPDPTVMAKPFVDGYTLRLLWEDLEPTRDGFDFSPIGTTLANMAAQGHHKGLTLEILPRTPPTWLLAEPGIVTYTAQAVASQGTGTETLPVPWDPFLLSRWEAFTGALAAHEVMDEQVGGMVPLASHSRLKHINAEIPGLGGVRDLGNRLVNAPVYDRAALLGCISRAINATEDNFPSSHVFLLYFNMSDGQNPPLAGEILGALRTEFFPGGVEPRVGLFKENFSCTNPVVISTDAYVTERNRTFIMFQALQGWAGPFSNPEATDACLVFDPPLADGWQTGDLQVDNAIRRTAVSGPEVGMRHCMENFKAYYFELYISDLSLASFDDDFQLVHDEIFAAAPVTAQDGWVSY